MAFDKDKLRDIQNKNINPEHVEDVFELFTSATNQLKESVNTDEFEDWVQATLQEIFEKGKIASIGFGLTENEDHRGVEVFICSNLEHKFKPINIRYDDPKYEDSYTEQEFTEGIAKWMPTTVDIFDALFDKLMLQLDLEVGEPEMIKNDTGFKFLSKVSID